jgi:hypothetical protein
VLFRTGQAMFNLVGWMAVGAVLGFLYGWHRTAPGFQHSTAVLYELQPGISTRRRVLAHMLGHRIGGCLIGAVAGAALGLLTWTAGYVIILLATSVAAPISN